MSGLVQPVLKALKESFSHFTQPTETLLGYRKVLLTCRHLLQTMRPIVFLTSKISSALLIQCQRYFWSWTSSGLQLHTCNSDAQMWADWIRFLSYFQPRVMHEGGDLGNLQTCLWMRLIIIWMCVLCTSFCAENSWGYWVRFRHLTFQHWSVQTTWELQLSYLQSFWTSSFWWLFFLAALWLADCPAVLSYPALPSWLFC